MKKPLCLATLSVVFLVVSGCAHLAYLGVHGTSVRLHPDIHQSISADDQCLECHGGGQDAPQTPHPGFTGCIKCHND